LLQDQFAGNRLEQSLAQDIAMGPSDIVRRPQSLVRNRKARGKLLIYSQWRTWLKHWYVLIHAKSSCLLVGIVNQKRREA